MKCNLRLRYGVSCDVGFKSTNSAIKRLVKRTKYSMIYKLYLYEEVIMKKFILLSMLLLTSIFIFSIDLSVGQYIAELDGEPWVLNLKYNEDIDGYYFYADNKNLEFIFYIDELTGNRYTWSNNNDKAIFHFFENKIIFYLRGDEDIMYYAYLQN